MNLRENCTVAWIYETDLHATIQKELQKGNITIDDIVAGNIDLKHKEIVRNCEVVILHINKKKRIIKSRY